MAVTQLLEPLMDTLEGIRMPTRFIHLDRTPPATANGGAPDAGTAP